MSIGAVGALANAPGKTGQHGLSGMKSEDFFRLLVTEMQNQDPFEPSDTGDIISKVSQIRSIEQSSSLNDTLNLLTQQQRMGGTSGLIGKFVQAIIVGPDGGQTLSQGVVTGVRFLSDGSAVLELDTGDAVNATDVVRVTTFDDATSPAAAPGSEDGEDDGTTGGGDKADQTQRQRTPGQIPRGTGRSWLGLDALLRL